MVAGQCLIRWWWYCWFVTATMLFGRHRSLFYLKSNVVFLLLHSTLFRWWHCSRLNLPFALNHFHLVLSELIEKNHWNIKNENTRHSNGHANMKSNHIANERKNTIESNRIEWNTFGMALISYRISIARVGDCDWIRLRNLACISAFADNWWWLTWSWWIWSRWF